MNRAAAIAFALALGVTACADDPEPDLAVDPTTEEPAASEFGTLDANGDSYLDVDEVAEWAEDTDTDLFGDWDVDGNSELDRGEITGGAFELWDTDDNDIVSQAEWEEGVDRWYPDDADPVVFGDLDNDGDSSSTSMSSPRTSICHRWVRAGPPIPSTRRRSGPRTSSCTTWTTTAECPRTSGPAA